MATTTLSNVIVPEIFAPAVIEQTSQLSPFVTSGLLTQDARLNSWLTNGAGYVNHLPFWNDLGDTDADIITDNPATLATPTGLTMGQEIQVALRKHKSWSSMGIVQQLQGTNPLQAIIQLSATYWQRRLQQTVLAVLAGVFADNDAAPTGTEHVAEDLTHDVKGSAYSAGVTNFTLKNFLNAKLLLGELSDSLTFLLIHPVVYNSMKIQNDVITIPASNGVFSFDTYVGSRVIQSSALPNPSSGVYHSYLFGAGALVYGIGTPAVPVETERVASGGNGGGEELLHNRVNFCVHPTGHAFVPSPSQGGPSNAATSGNLAHADSWKRVFPERNQIKIARLITRES